MKGWIVVLCVALLCGCAPAKAEEEPTQEMDNVADESAVLTPGEKKERFLTEKLMQMSQEQKVGQLLMCDFRKDEKGENITEINDAMTQGLQNRHLGGIILFAENMDTSEQTMKLIEELQKAADMPLFIGVDEEGGRVSRLHKSGKIEATNIPPAMKIAETGDVNLAYDAGTTIGKELSQLGFNVDFAPIADIHTNPANTVIGDRAFGTDPQTAAPMVAAFVRGLQERNVSGAAKHFPGHGDTATDTHDGQVFVEHDLERLKTIEFVPFQSAIDAGVDMIMVGHIKTPNVTTDNYPATLSHDMVTGILREEMGFEGIVITDAMNMGAIVQEYGSDEAAVLAVLAGVDIVLMPADYVEAYTGLLEAVQSGRISHERLDESVLRILSLKYEKGFFADGNQ